jgi:hypothetical protein
MESLVRPNVAAANATRLSALLPAALFVAAWVALWVLTSPGAS